MWVAAAYAELKCPIRSRGVVLAVNAPTGGVHREESRLEGPESRSRRRAKIWRSQYAERGALRRRTRRARADRGRKCRRAAAMSGNSPITFGLSAHAFDSPLRSLMVYTLLTVLPCAADWRFSLSHDINSTLHPHQPPRGRRCKGKGPMWSERAWST